MKEDIEDVIIMFYLVINSSSNINSGEMPKISAKKESIKYLAYVYSSFGLQ